MLKSDKSVNEVINQCQHKIDSIQSKLDLSTKGKNYAGTTENNNLIFKHKRSLFSGLLSYPKVYGSIYEDTGTKKTIVQFDIYGFTGVFIVLSILLVLALSSQLLFMHENQIYLLLFLVIGFVFIYFTSLISVKLISNKIIRDFTF